VFSGTREKIQSRDQIAANLEQNCGWKIVARAKD